MTNNDLILITGNKYGNDIGKAIIIEKEYTGFPGKTGALVSYVGKGDKVGFVAHSNYSPLPVLDPKRKNINPVVDEKISPLKTLVLIEEKINSKKKSESISPNWENPFTDYNIAYSSQRAIPGRPVPRIQRNIVTPGGLLRGQRTRNVRLPNGEWIVEEI